MSSLNEQDPLNPNDPTYYAPRRLRERVSSEPIRSPISHPPSLAPEVIDEPPGPGRRAALFSVAGRFAAVAGFVMIVVLFFVFMLPASRQSDAGLTSSEITGSTRAALPQSGQGDNGSKPALAEFQALLASAPPSKPATHEQSQQLLQQFLQWRQKADSSQ